MNFFEKQEQARKHTALLSFYFVVAVILIVVACDVIVLGSMLYINQDQHFIRFQGGYQITPEAIVELGILVSLVVSPIVLLVIFLGTLFKMISLREGGLSVAKMVNAKPLDLSSQDMAEKRFINVVEEMAIASGVSIPKLFVMEDELAINAFVAGIKPEDRVMVVTRGALDQLTRDELQGVVGHEFSHIFNSDMKINLRLIGILGGIFVIGQLGYYLMRLVGNSDSRSRREKDGRLTLAIFLLGLGLFLIGYIGLFFGRLIKASISRQRELLADAASVQYTRNPQGLVYALRRIEQNEEGTYLKTKYVEDISHLCFCSSRALLFRSLLATHPPIPQRIKELDPQGLYSQNKLPETQVPSKPQTDKKPTSTSTLKPADFLPVGLAMGANMAMAIPVKTIVNDIGNVSDSHINYAQQLMQSLPPNTLKFAHQPEQVELLFYALILPSDENSLAQARRLLTTKLTTEQNQAVMDLVQELSSLPQAKLPLIDIAIPAYRENPLAKRQQIFENLNELALLEEDLLFPFFLTALIGRYAKSVTTPISREKYPNFDPVLTEVSFLLAIVIRYGHPDPQHAAALYQKVMKEITDKNLPLVEINRDELKNLAAILAKLNHLYPLCKQKLLHTCLECIRADGKISLEEAEIVRAIAASLDCPVPPLLPDA